MSGAFPAPFHVSRPARAALSKSSTLTMRHREMTRECMLLVRKNGGGLLPASTAAQELVLKSPQGGRARDSLAFSGSNQAREGRLVNALAVRGDEGRDTLR